MRSAGLSRRIRNLGNIILRMLDRADRDVAMSAVECLDECSIEYLGIKTRRNAE